MTQVTELAWPDAERLADDSVLAIPLGATEQHGPHLPLTTDTDIAVAIVDAAAAAHPQVVAAPPVAYGASGEHQAFAGTLSIGQEATERLLVELCRSASATFARIMIVSCHGGNAGPLARAVAQLRREGRDVRAWAPRFGGDAHAGRTETSLMLAIAPERVRVAEAATGATAPITELLPRLQRDGVRVVSANGVLGDPRGATVCEGRELLALAAAQLRGVLATWGGA
jgi:creatinine amidohydrolase